MAEPQIYMLFCEDAREELGNKTSFMGVLGPQITLNRDEGSNGRLKSLVIGAMCRFFDEQPQEGEFDVRFIAASDDMKVPPSPGPRKVSFSSDDDADEWTVQIIGTFQNLPVHIGMRIESSCILNGKEYKASLVVNAPD